VNPASLISLFTVTTVRIVVFSVAHLLCIPFISVRFCFLPSASFGFNLLCFCDFFDRVLGHWFFAFISQMYDYGCFL
jgi:hypothetical protein